MDPGTYALLIYVPYDLAINVGQLGNVDFKSGYYTYIGSALGGLGGRVRRHLREEKKVHWHIDHLLLRARAVDVILGRGKVRKECQVSAELAKHLPSIPGFGSSDCKCLSHLFYSPDLNELRTAVLSGFKNSGMKPMKMEDVH